MRIWLCPSAFAPHTGGVEELTLKLARHLQLRDHEVLVVSNRHPSLLPASDEVDGVPVRRLKFSLPARRPRSWLEHVLAMPALRSDLAAFQPPHLVHVICVSSQTAPLAAFARRQRVPLVMTTQGETSMDSQAIYRKNPWLVHVLGQTSKRAQALTACSDWARHDAGALARAFLDAQVIPNGVDVGDWAMDPPSNEPVFAGWGRHVRQKGFDLLLDAFQRVRCRIPAARLLLGGDGPEQRYLFARAGDGVEVLGPLNRSGVREMLAKARVAVVPSRIEPFGIVALEALAAGRGLVYSSNGGLREAAGTCGRAADPTDAEALSEAMIAELKEPTAPDAGRRRACELSWDGITDQYEAVYERVVLSSRP